MDDIDSTVDSIRRTTDNQMRIQLATQLVDQLESGRVRLDGKQTDSVVDSVNEWLHASNFKVSLCSIEVLTAICSRAREGFAKYLCTVLPSLIEALKHSNDQVREQVRHLICMLMDTSSTPQAILDRLLPGLQHKGWRVRDEVLVLIRQTLLTYGRDAIALSKISPQICALLSDANMQVRETAIEVLVEMYRHVGDRLKQDIDRRNLIPASRKTPIYIKFEEMKRSGDMLPPPDPFAKPLPMNDSKVLPKSDDAPKSRLTTHRVSQPTLPSYVAGALGGGSATAASRGGGATSKASRNTLGAVSSTRTAGAVSWDSFVKAFEQDTPVTVYSGKSLEEELKKISEVLDNSDLEWTVRVKSLKRFRGLLKAGCHEYPEFFAALKGAERVFASCVKDLRSQVCRECCLCIAFTSKTLGDRAAHFSEAVMTSLFTLVPNSAKVMSTSGGTALDFIVQYTHSPRLLPVIASHATSKTISIRRQVICLLEDVFSYWDPSLLDRNLPSLTEALKRAITDADEQVRKTGRKTFAAFKEQFPSQADSLFSSLDAKARKHLEDSAAATGLSSHSSSVSSLSNFHTSSLKGSQESVNAKGTSSTSSKQWSLAPTNNVTSKGIAKPNRTAQSTPGSRSHSRGTSPSGTRLTPKLSTGAANAAAASGSLLPRTPTSTATSSRTTRRSGIPQSLGSSRDHSPTSGARTYLGGKTPRPASVTGGHLSMAQSAATQRFSRTPGERAAIKPTSNMRMLQKTSDTEAAIADALARSSRRRFDSYQYSDDESDASSVCSYGSGPCGNIENLHEVLELCNSQTWSDRKEGLSVLHKAIQEGIPLSHSEVKRATEIFSRMFHDPHAKVMSLFLEVLADFIWCYREALQDWLNLLLTKLLQKTGTENLLNSGLQRVNKCLCTVQESFSIESQFASLMRFISDQSLTKSLKVKISVLRFLQLVIDNMRADMFSNSSETRQMTQIIVGWTQDKHSDVRRLANGVLTSLFELNIGEFFNLQSSLPKQCQDLVNHLLLDESSPAPRKSSVSNTSGNSPLSPFSNEVGYHAITSG